MGINVSYPSGVLHEYQNGRLTRHMFLLVHTEDGQPLPAGVQSDAIRLLPAGDYICRKISTHMSGSVREEMKEVLKSDSFSVIETDTSSARNKKNGYPFELQYLAQ